MLDDERQITRQADNMPGFPGQPMSRADVERKFRSNVGKRTLREGVDPVLQALWTLDQTDDLRVLLGKICLQA
jgi:2-methylcitrate dehydratase